MRSINRKKKRPFVAGVIICIAMYSVLALFVVGLFLFNDNYTDIYDSPKVNGGTVDFSGADITSRDVACNLAGEWEFYYNKWIVTDGDTDSEPDGLIELPGVWTYKDYGYGKLPKTGYGSYRLVAKNVQSDIDVEVFRYYGDFAYRAFINGQLNIRSGTLAKTVEDTEITGWTAERHAYKTDGGDLEIVIEVGASDSGGFNGAPWLSSVSAGISFGDGLRSFSYVALGVAGAAVCISILTFLFFRHKRDYSASAFLLALFLHLLSSKDMLYVIKWDIPVSMTASLITAIAAFLLFVYHLRQIGVRPKPIPFAVAAAFGGIFLTLMLVFYGTPLSPVFAFLMLADCSLCMIPLVFSKSLTDIRRGIYCVLFVFLMSIFCFELCDRLSMLVFGTEFIFTCELMVIIACFAVLWLWDVAKTARVAIRAGELECELAALKTKALKAQIKPHFIYNSLTAIQARYRDGMNEGDKAIEQFANHMRLITDSEGDDVIAFNDEVNNVLNYFELENLRHNGKLNLLLDLEHTDFYVPVLSIQPLVENAVRHAGLTDTADGYIALSSVKTDGAIIVTVSDNGKGFDVNAVRPGVGLENTRKRFELINAKMHVESGDGGTCITIEIPTE